MGSRRVGVGYIVAFVVVALGTPDVRGFSGTPVLTLNSTRYCVGDTWNLKVTTDGLPNINTRLLGISNDVAWEIPEWATTDGNGSFSTTGIFALSAVGKHALHVETSFGSTSDILSFEVSNCGGIWRNTTSLNVGGVTNTATLLATGKVLVTTGAPFPNIGNTAELYDPVSETWSVTGKLNSSRGSRDERTFYTATLLTNGKVLVAGGLGPFPQGFLTSAELYDPVTGAWSPTGAMNSRRAEHTATLLPDGKVLVVGGSGDWGIGGGAELYDPSTGTWTSTGNLISDRVRFTATLLPDGKVLVAGGGRDDHCDGGPNAELYDPVTGRWSPTGYLNHSRSGHTANLLPNGKVLVVGGYHYCKPLNSAELYDPATGTWSFTGTPTMGRLASTATLLASGKVLIAGGGGGSGEGVPVNSAEAYDPVNGTWSPASMLLTARFMHAATSLPNGNVLIVGGGVSTDGGVDVFRTAEIFEGGFEIPQLALNSTTYCAGAVWAATVKNGSSRAPVRLMGVSNDAYWEIAQWGDTDANGSFTTNGTIAGGSEGAHTLRVEIRGVWSNTFSFTIMDCRP
jgi:hypothetical protein